MENLRGSGFLLLKSNKEIGHAGPSVGFSKVIPEK
jgi:hypothetical protein